MHHQEQQLQRLRGRFSTWLSWLRQATNADVRILPLGQGNAFKLRAIWKGKDDGQEQTHEKVYDVAVLLRMGNVGCTKDYARAFVKEVLEKRGVL